MITNLKHILDSTLEILSKKMGMTRGTVTLIQGVSPY